MAPWMKLLTVTVVLSLYAVAGKRRRSFISNHFRVFGGEEAAEHEFPSQVFILSNKLWNDGRRSKMFCGGSIISESWVLTAAHCLDHNIDTLVYGGAAELDNTVEREGKRILIHENYTLYGRNENNAANDVGLIELNEPFVLDGVTFDALSLPDCCKKPILGSGYVLPGWGRFTYSRGNIMRSFGPYHIPWASSTLKKLPMDVINCPVNYSDQKVICTRYENGSGPCDGDSGGPLIQEGVIYGVISFVDTLIDVDPNEVCDREGVWTVFMSVSDFRFWIHGITGI